MKSFVFFSKFLSLLFHKVPQFFVQCREIHPLLSRLCCCTRLAKLFGE